MSLLFESIRVEKRLPQNLEAHLERMRVSRRILWNIDQPIDPGFIRVPEEVDERIWKCRIMYDTDIQDITFQPYVKRSIINVRIIEATELQYPLKYTDRASFLKFFNDKAGVDDLIFSRKGFITDSSFSNLAFFDGSRWYTPTTYLLAGTRRARLLREGRIAELAITISELALFQRVSFINAMLDLDELTIETSGISQSSSLFA